MLHPFQIALVLVMAIATSDLRSMAADCPKSPDFACTLETEGDNGNVHLSGRLRVTTDQIEFEAYPQVEYITWHCGQITTIEVTGRHKTTVAIRSADTSYSFGLRTSAQASSFVEIARCGCPKGD